MQAVHRAMDEILLLHRLQRGVDGAGSGVPGTAAPSGQLLDDLVAVHRGFGEQPQYGRLDVAPAGTPVAEGAETVPSPTPPTATWVSGSVSSARVVMRTWLAERTAERFAIRVVFLSWIHRDPCVCRCPATCRAIRYTSRYIVIGRAVNSRGRFRLAGAPVHRGRRAGGR